MIVKPGLTLYGLFIVMALLAAAALLLGVAVSSILVLLLVYAALAYSINFITGMIGYVDFGHVLFMAIGSYALATLVSYYGANPLLGVGLGALLRMGFGIRAIKNEEDAASSVGVSPRTLKLTGYMLGGLFGGAGGAVYAWSISGVTAGSAFDFTFSLLMLAMIIIGGMGTSIGPLLGAGSVLNPSYFLSSAVCQRAGPIYGVPGLV